MDRIKVLRQRKADLTNEADALADKDAAGTASVDEIARLDAIIGKGGDLEKVNASIAREEAVMEAKRTMPAVDNVNADTQAEQTDRLPAEAKKPTPKFKSLGEQLAAVARAAMNPSLPISSVDNRLIYQAAPTGANESIPSEGGFLVQQDFSTALLNLMHEQGEILSRVRRIPIGAGFNGVKFPVVDESSRANGSRWGGVQGYWADEAGTVTASKPKLRQMDLSLKKLMAVGYATDELLADTSALEQIFTTAFVEELVFKTEDAVINGTGSGQPLGILNSGALVTVTPESGQAAATIRTENVLKMWARTPIRSRRSMVWMCNQDIEPQLYQLTLGSGTAVVLLYTPPGSNGNTSGYGLLLGRPVIPNEFSATLGTAGDLLLWDPQAYVMIDKNGIEQASSMHVAFLSAENCYRFIYRLDGQPVERVAKTPYKGSGNTISPYIALGTRA